MEETNALQERETAPVYVCEIAGYCASLEQEVRRQRWKTFRYIIYTALIAAVYTTVIMDVERSVICGEESVICLEWEKRDGSPRD